MRKYIINRLSAESKVGGDSGLEIRRFKRCLDPFDICCDSSIKEFTYAPFQDSLKSVDVGEFGVGKER